MKSIFAKSKLHKNQSRKKGTELRCLRLESLEDRRVLATFTVSSTDDAGPDTLRRALELANLNPGPDDVVFDEALSGSTITLGGSELYVSDTLTIDASPLTENVTIDANQSSRVIHSVNADLAIAGLTLLNGTATSGGGGIRISDGSLTVTESIVSGNSVAANDGFGGGIYSIDGGVTLSGSTVSDNSASGFYARGGGIYSRNGLVTLNDSTVSGNSASGTLIRGGGIATNNGDVTLHQSTVNGNSASGSSATGGGIYTLYNDVTLHDSTVSANTASGSNGAIGGGITSSSIVTVTGSSVSENTVTGGSDVAGGGGISAAKITLTDSTVSGNQAAGAFASGGGIRARYSIFDSGVTLTRSTVSGNIASGLNSSASGGGIRVNNAYSTIVLYDSTVSANTASSNGSSASGGGISSDRVELNNSTVSGNLASANGSSAFGAGVSGAGGTFQSLKLTNSTVSSNTASAIGADAFGGGLEVGYPNSSTVIINSIVAGNTVAPGNQAPDANIGGQQTVEYSLIGDNSGTGLTESQNPDANGNLIGGIVDGVIDAVLGPLADNGGPTQTRALLPDSPAIDAGDPAAMTGIDGVPLFDQRGSGFSRISDGEGDGIARLDMGAFEIQGLNVEPIADAGMDQTTVQALTVTLDGSGSFDQDGPEPLTYSWEVLDGPGSATLGTPNAVATSFQAETIGIYLVELTVDDGAATSTDTVTVTVDFNSPPTPDTSLSDVQGQAGVRAILDGSASSDPDDEPLTYEWTLLAAPTGSSATIDDPNAEMTFFVPDLPGDYTFELTVCDSFQCATSDPHVIAVSPMPGDFNEDGVVNGDDIDLLCLAIRDGDQDPVFDLNGNGVVETTDYELLLEMMETKLGDANLDGIVDGLDFIIWNQNKFTSGDPALPGVGWATADFDCDGFTDGIDFIIWNQNKFTMAIASDEPSQQRLEDLESETPASNPTIQATNELPQRPVDQASEGRPLFSCRVVRGGRSELIDAAFDDQEDLATAGWVDSRG